MVVEAKVKVDINIVTKNILFLAHVDFPSHRTTVSDDDPCEGKNIKNHISK